MTEFERGVRAAVELLNTHVPQFTFNDKGDHELHSLVPNPGKHTNKPVAWRQKYHKDLANLAVEMLEGT